MSSGNTTLWQLERTLQLEKLTRCTMARAMPAQQSTGAASRARPLPPIPAGDDAGLDIFGSLGSGLASVFDGVKDAVSLPFTTDGLRPISEHGHGDATAARPSSRPPSATSRWVPSSSADSPQPSARSKASTKGGVARFGEAAESYYVAKLGGRTAPAGVQRRRGSASSLDTSGAQRAAAEQRMWDSLPSARDGLKPKTKDPCDKATHSKINTWMSKAAPAPPPADAAFAQDGGNSKPVLLLF